MCCYIPNKHNETQLSGRYGEGGRDQSKSSSTLWCTLVGICQAGCRLLRSSSALQIRYLAKINRLAFCLHVCPKGCCGVATRPPLNEDFGPLHFDDYPLVTCVQPLSLQR